MTRPDVTRVTTPLTGPVNLETETTWGQAPCVDCGYTADEHDGAGGQYGGAEDACDEYRMPEED